MPTRDVIPVSITTYSRPTGPRRWKRLGDGAKDSDLNSTDLLNYLDKDYCASLIAHRVPTAGSPPRTAAATGDHQGDQRPANARRVMWRRSVSPGWAEAAGSVGRVSDVVVPDQPPPSRRTLAFIVVPIVALIVVGNVGNAIHPTLVNDHPLVLIAMEPRNRFLLLVAGQVDYWTFLLVATVRRLASDPLFYLLGYRYGDAGVRWMERRMGDDVGMVRAMERGFKKAGPVLVFFFPGLFACVLAGATRMRPAAFMAYNIAGTLTVVTLLYRFAEVFDGPLGSVNRFYGNNGKVLTIVSVSLTVLWLLDQRRRGKSDIKSVSNFEDELRSAGGDQAGEVEGDLGSGGGVEVAGQDVEEPRP
ncbi:MAG: VTT domain-containing protein [Acidimicrobiales bacterium]